MGSVLQIPPDFLRGKVLMASLGRLELVSLPKSWGSQRQHDMIFNLSIPTVNLSLQKSK